MQNYELFLNMQNIRQKKTHFFFVICLFMVINAVFGQHEQKLAKADLLFKERKYEKARALYEELRYQDKQFSEQSLLKLAFIAEKSEQNDAKAMFYLSLFYEKTKNKQAQAYLISLAQRNKASGYHFGDAEFFAEIYTNFKIVFFLFFLVGFSGLCFWLWKRLEKRKFSRTLYYVSGTAAVAFLILILLNTDFRQAYAIVTDENALLHTEPSAGAEVVGRVTQGSRVLIGKQTDIWREIFWEDKKFFLRNHQIGVVLSRD
jgi:hypothetical protein